MEKIKFQIEIDRILDVLSKEIYDSSYALLRENIQNAYDAILMRVEYSENFLLENGLIKVSIDKEKIIISDNGIGMSEDVIKNNYWNAGSSGKKTELAMLAGVVGTFGIGGMANFGVCSEIIIETESIETKERIMSRVERSNLSIYEDCISIEKIKPTGNYGTKIIVKLDPDVVISSEQASDYILPYIKYLPIKTELNGEYISQKSLEVEYYDELARLNKTWDKYVTNDIQADVIIQCNELGRITAIVKNIYMSDKNIEGNAYLRQDFGHLWGLKNYFGLAPIPLKSFYSLGGIMNLSLISPTAGREALSKESIEIAKNIINLAENCATNTLADSDLSNRNTAFMEHVISKGNIEMAKNLKVRVVPEQEMTLGLLKTYSKDKKFYYYDASDESIIKQFGTPDTPLIVVSRRYPRRRIERLYIKKFCDLEEIKDAPQIFEIYRRETYDFTEMALIIQLKRILEDTYAVKNVEINFAEISHSLPFLVIPPEGKDDHLEINIQKNHSSIKPVLISRGDSYEVFVGFIHDYIRNYLYTSIRDWVPSSTREGAETLQKILRSKRELYEYRREDIGLTSLISEYMSGKASIEELIDRSKTIKKSKSEEITRIYVGKIENEIPDLVNNPIKPLESKERELVFNPMPPILRTDVKTSMKLLMAEKQNPVLNNFEMFFAISDRAFREEYSFFVIPHTTRIIWGGRRIIFIFTHASGKFSLYYDIELFEDTGNIAGGDAFSTTTIVTKNRIFIPIPHSLKRFFELTDREKRQFYVRYDVLY